jgi:hypothetical protein
MGKLAEFLAGCPREGSGAKEPAPWGSLREFPGFMLDRMYILLSRPKQAIGEFGAGDYRTPFLFFAFFMIVLSFLTSLASELQLAMLLSGHQAGNALDLFFSHTISFLVFGTFERYIHAFLFLGISVIILALFISFITGVRSWNPAFTISAYCLPVSSLLYTVLAVLQIPQPVPDFLSVWLSLAFSVTGFIFKVVIAGYGISALTKTPIRTAVIAALSWTVIWMLAIWGAQNFVILSFESGTSQWISATFYPNSFPTAAALGSNP